MTGEQTNPLTHAQEALHAENHDYVVGSPHLRHAVLRSRLNTRIHDAVADVVARQGGCEVLEIGAGHGSFTDVALAAGGRVTVTEMSRFSYEHLARRFADDERVTVVLDPDGDAPFADAKQYDVILLISVVHHIPDYTTTICRLVAEHLAPAGSLVTFQDPLWYPTQSRMASIISWASYFAWRVTQGEVRRGIRTRLRRLRGSYDDNEPSDTVEYHVMREGVDHEALLALLSPVFRSVRLDRYFSTQSPLVQKIGGKRFPANTFGITASGHVDPATSGRPSTS